MEIDEEVKQVFRALRFNEIHNLIKYGKLIPPCYPCIDIDIIPDCCNITASQHVTSGTKAKTKSSWISTSKLINIAAIWSSRKKKRMNSHLLI